MKQQLQDTLFAHRDRLVRWFLSQTGDPHTAEDLAQETIIEAWDNRHKLTDLSGIAAWLNAIAANIFKRHLRRSNRDHARFAPLDDDSTEADLRVDFDLSRNDLVALLDRALNELPAETRQIVLMRYLEDLPQSQVAQVLGISENSVAVKLHRGKLQLRVRLQAEERGDAATTGWQRTSIWCPNCGQATYEGKLDSQTGELVLYCPHCTPGNRLPAWEHRETAAEPVVRGLVSFKPALNRVMQHTAANLIHALSQGKMRCVYCGAEVPIQRTMPDFLPKLWDDHPGIHSVCERCGDLSYIALSGIAISTPEAIQFWKDHPRIQSLPVWRSDNTIVIPIQSVNQPAAKLEVIFAEDTFELLRVTRTEDDHA